MNMPFNSNQTAHWQCHGKFSHENTQNTAESLPMGAGAHWRLVVLSGPVVSTVHAAICEAEGGMSVSASCGCTAGARGS